MRAGGHLPDVFRREFRRGGKTVANILVALAENLQIKRQNQGGALGRFGAIDQIVDEVTVAHHIELEPERLGCCRCDILD